MVGFYGIDASSRPAGVKQSTARGGQPLRHIKAPDARVDISSISVAAQNAAAAQKVKMAGTESPVHTERVEAAKRRIQEGAYQLQSVVREVAARIGDHVGIG